MWPYDFKPNKKVLVYCTGASHFTSVTDYTLPANVPDLLWTILCNVWSRTTQYSNLFVNTTTSFRFSFHCAAFSCHWRSSVSSLSGAESQPTSNLMHFKSSQVYFFNSRIKYTAKLHNTKVYSEIYTQQNYAIKSTTKYREKKVKKLINPVYW